MTSIFNSLIVMISILIAVAFYTIMERKILSYMQTRKGPNKVGFMGLLQPFSDALKLFNKTSMTPLNSNYMMMNLAPALALILSLIMWPIMPLAIHHILDSSLNTLVFFVISSLTVYTILSIGWSANSKYSQLGATRSIAQMISYEINFFMIILLFLMLFHSYQMSDFFLPQKEIPLLLGAPLLILVWMMTCLAEVNRSPFDFAEGESELVSGFNIEYLGGLFALIFLAEYSNMVLLSFISVALFTGKLTSFMNLTTILIFTTTLLWVRATFPRFRFDMLMKTNWKTLLPITTTLLLPILSFSFLVF